MKVSISVAGRFHAFDLAKCIQDHGCLSELLTSYPAFFVKKFGIEKEKVKSFIPKEIFGRVHNKIFGTQSSFDFILNDIFDIYSSNIISTHSDIYILWSGGSLRTIKKIRKKNSDAVIIIERGSAHIEEQAEILKRLNGKDIVSRKFIEKETEEYELADFISLPGKYAFNSFIKRGFNEEKLLVNNYGVDLSSFVANNRPETKESCLKVGYAGNISSQKGVMELIMAVEDLIKEGLKMELYLTGNVDSLTFDVSLLNKDFIIYHKAVPQGELNKFYHGIDVFVLNTYQDGFGMVILQALACGVPVIGTTHSGALDVIEDGRNGFIIEAGNESQLKNKLAWFNSNRDSIPVMSKESRESVEKGFSWQEYGARYIKNLQIINSGYKVLNGSF